MAATIVTAWHNPDQLDRFLDAWGVTERNPHLLLQRDTDREGCALTKNRGIHKAKESGASIIVVLDDDCYPSSEAPTLAALIDLHVEALQLQAMPMCEPITDPPSRGTPYYNRCIVMPVAASMGYWLGVGDYDAPAQLIRGADQPMKFNRGLMHGRYFPLSGMNLAFRANQFPYCQFINVPRFDDIWQGFIWQRHAYATGQCFNLGGPLVTHSRQSDVFANLRAEAPNLEANEEVWACMARSPSHDYHDLIALLPGVGA